MPSLQPPRSSLKAGLRPGQRLLAGLLWLVWSAVSASAMTDNSALPFPRPLDSYADAALPQLGARLLFRIQADPFNLLASLLFLGAILHTFLAGRFTALAHRYQHRLDALPDRPGQPGPPHPRRDRLQFKAQLCHFLGEIEAIFGIWLLPLGLAIILGKGWPSLVHYASTTSFAEPVFVVVVMAMASSRPILCLAEACLGKIAALGGGGTAAWWFAILTIGPILGSFITEPAAMTICALLLSRKFYRLHPSPPLRYATLALLFVNISVGGTLTHFAAPPIIMVAGKWGWGMAHMFQDYGWKAALGILAANLLYFLRFLRELSTLQPPDDRHQPAEPPIPLPITLIHLLFIAWVVFTAHYPPLVILGFLFFLAFVEATRHHQRAIGLRAPLLVGFFLAALVVHGGCQQWWIAPVLGSLGRWPLMLGATLLTAVNDNAAITYLASLVPGFSDALKHAVVAGAVTGGGLTVIANAPNPAGQSILQKHFGPDGISPLKLFLYALIPTVIMGAAFMFLP